MEGGKGKGFAIGLVFVILFVSDVVPMRIHCITMQSLDSEVKPSIDPGGAAVSPETVRYFLSLDMKVRFG